MSENKKNIRFINSEYETLFSIPDGSNIVLNYGDGSSKVLPCAYIDDYHTQIGYSVFHICEFAEKMEAAGIRYTPEIPQLLPERCYSTLPSTGELIQITNGERTYQKCSFSTPDREENKRIANERNKKLGVTRQQAAAMQGGSIHGWSTPAARTSSYDLAGIPIRPTKGKPKPQPSKDAAR